MHWHSAYICNINHTLVQQFPGRANLTPLLVMLWHGDLAEGGTRVRFGVLGPTAKIISRQVLSIVTCGSQPQTVVTVCD